MYKTRQSSPGTVLDPTQTVVLSEPRVGGRGERGTVLLCQQGLEAVAVGTGQLVTRETQQQDIVRDMLL